MGFQREHDTWIQEHMKRRAGERLDALRRGHGYGNQLFVELIWWPLVGHFDGLHPEYEVKDWRGDPILSIFYGWLEVRGLYSRLWTMAPTVQIGPNIEWI